MRFQFLQDILPQLDEVALSHFRAKNLHAENKSAADFDPVTIADREIEALFRKAVLSAFPDDGILGEEDAAQKAVSPYHWVIDPIDGTRAYIIGAPCFTTLIALNKDDECESAVISQPFTGERFFAHEDRAFWQRAGCEETIFTSSITSLSDAKLASTFPEIGSQAERKAFEKVARQVKLTRFGLDGYAYALLAMGQIDLVIEAGLQPYDYAAPQKLVSTAGGVVCDWQGEPPRGVSTILAAANQELANAALEVLNR